MRGAGKRQVTSGSGSFRIGHLANHSARIVYFVNQSEFKESTFMSPAPGAGNECKKVAIGLLWPIRKQVVNSVNQSEHDAKTFCWFQAWENAGELWICLWLVEKVLVARFFFGANHNAHQCKYWSGWKEWGRRTLFKVDCLFLTFFVCLPFQGYVSCCWWKP